MFNRNDPPNATNLKTALKPALYDPPGSAAKAAAPAVRTGLPPQPAPVKESPPVAPPNTSAAPTSGATTGAALAAEAGGSKLFIGVNIKLKGVEISDCDVLVIEGHVEATVHSKEMQIDRPGTLTGTALIDVAEIRGEFSGELTARTRLVVHGTGRVSGTIRYGKLIVAEGGELTGDVKRLDADEQAQRSLLPSEARRPQAAASDPVPTLTNPVHPGATRTYSS
ncbi:MAG: polymer-forming cytoskeletal protein [Betaproteobacteria bacterium]|nr:MAG: polymer-forming cytoskeletal protein [Betaproteobacteria bacterium]